MDDAAIHHVSGDAVDLSLRLPVPSGSLGAFSPRDDNIERFTLNEGVITLFPSYSRIAWYLPSILRVSPISLWTRLPSSTNSY